MIKFYLILSYNLSFILRVHITKLFPISLEIFSNFLFLYYTENSNIWIITLVQIECHKKDICIPPNLTPPHTILLISNCVSQISADNNIAVRVIFSFQRKKYGSKDDAFNVTLMKPFNEFHQNEAHNIGYGSVVHHLHFNCYFLGESFSENKQISQSFWNLRLLNYYSFILFNAR